MDTENAAQPMESAPADEASIIANLSAVLEGREPEKPKQEQAAQTEQPAASDQDATEEPADADTGDNQDGEQADSNEQDSEPETPAIEPPASWSKADKELFAQLPPETQAIVARRESERDKGVREATAKAAEERKAAEAERAQAAQERTHYARQLQQLIPTLASQVNDEFANIDWVKLSKDDPADYVAKRAQYDARMGALEAAQREAARLEQARRGEFEQQRHAHMVEQREKLLEALPDLKDPAKGEKLTKALVSYAKQLGFADDQIESIHDHKSWVVLNKARLYDEAQKSKAASTDKPKAPVIVKPGAAQQTGKQERAAAELTAAKAQLGKSRSTEEQAAILARFMK